MTVRSFRNNNPGNLEAGDHWQGLMAVSTMTPQQRAETRFAVFSSPKWGFRALAVILLNYQHKHGINTIRGIVERFAPANENNTAAYISAISQGIKRGPDEPLDFTNPATLQGFCKAIAIHEAGSWLFLDDDLVAGVRMAENGELLIS